MTQNGISYVLNASNSCPKPDFICESRFLRVPINDNYCEKLLPWLDKSIEFIGEAPGLASARPGPGKGPGGRSGVAQGLPTPGWVGEGRRPQPSPGPLSPDKAKLSSCQVIVHCLAGISRSATIAIAYIMKTMGMSSDDAYR